LCGSAKGDEILGNHAGFHRLAALQIRVGQLSLRFVHGRFEAAVYADFNQLQQRRHVPRDPGGKLLEHGGCLVELT
jgi:hypothetical protein